MLAGLLEVAWLLGVVGSIAFLISGVWLVWRYQSSASAVEQHTIARLALHESLRQAELENLRAAGARAQSTRTIATVRSMAANHEGKRRVLVVEDNLDSVRSLAKLIKLMGHECDFAINGFAALKVAREFRPDIILLDIGLPDLKGYDIARQLKWEPGLQGTRMLAVTALPESERQRALDAGCDGFYRKPLDPMLLEQLLAEEPRFEERQRSAA
ncbi:MAG TPA: response regulator [Burkholderiales bacterium]|nr:response regulator [Burkholderiales bacterium]